MVKYNYVKNKYAAKIICLQFLLKNESKVPAPPLWLRAFLDWGPDWPLGLVLPLWDWATATAGEEEPAEFPDVAEAESDFWRSSAKW